MFVSHFRGSLRTVSPPTVHCVQVKKPLKTREIQRFPLSQSTLVGLGPPSPLGSVTARSEAQIAEDRSIS